MTINISYVTQGMSMIISDKRLSHGLKGEYGYTDGNEKLINLKEMGWASGSGLYNFIEPFNQKLSKTTIEKIEDVMDIYEETVRQTVNQYPQYQEEIEKSIVSFSFHNFDFNEKEFKFHIGILKREYLSDHGIREVPNNVFYIIPPSDFTPYVKKTAHTNQQIKRNNNQFEDILKEGLEIFKELSVDSRFVSEECDIGIHTLLKDGIYKFKISGEVNMLLEKLDEGLIKERIKLIDKITRS